MRSWVCSVETHLSRQIASSFPHKIANACHNHLPEALKRYTLDAALFWAHETVDFGSSCSHFFKMKDILLTVVWEISFSGYFTLNKIHHSR